MNAKILTSFDEKSKSARILNGRVAERLKAPLSKSGRGESPSRVQIPPLPQID